MKNKSLKQLLFVLPIIFVLFLVTKTTSYAVVQSNCVNTAVGKAPGNSTCPNQGTGTGNTGNPIADYANELKNEIVANCPKTNFPFPGYATVNRNTDWCLRKVSASSSLKQIGDVISWLFVNLNEPGNFNLQCAGFAQAITIPFKQIPSAPSAFLPDDYGHNVPGYTWHTRTSTPMLPGDIVVWNSHIAVIISPVAANGDFTVAEANGGSGSVGKETYKNIPSQYGLTLYGFLRKN